MCLRLFSLKANTMITTKLEVLVDFGPKPDEKLVARTLESLRAQQGVREVEFRDEAFMVETELPHHAVVDLVARSTGRRAVLQGFGESESAVAMVSGNGAAGDNGPRGVVRFQQVSGSLVVDGCIDRLPPGPHGLHVRADGDITQGCQSLGPHYNPGGGSHGGPGGPRHAGDLGNIVADDHGRAQFRIVDDLLKVCDIIGRAIAVTERSDDLGRGESPRSAIDGDSGPAIACGIIARSAGIFQNPKRICLCDGVVVWDERDRPLAGAGRRGCCGDRGGVGTGEKQGKPCCKV